jgi:flagellar basal body rod protein FlgC
MSEFDVLSAAASGMDAQRITLEAAARNVAASEASGPGGFTRLVPTFEAAAPSDGDTLSDDGAFDEGDVLRFAGMRAERTVDGDAMSEMVAVLDAQRSYEANASIFDSAKRFAERAIDLGRQ